MRKLAGLVVLLAVFASAAAGDAPSGPPKSFATSRSLKPFIFDVEDGNYQAQNVPIDCGTNAIWLRPISRGSASPKRSGSR